MIKFNVLRRKWAHEDESFFFSKFEPFATKNVSKQFGHTTQVKRSGKIEQLPVRKA